MKLFLSLNASLKVAITTYIVSIIGFLVTLFLIFQGHSDIPYGLLFAGGVIGTTNLISGLIEHFSKDKSGSILSVAFIGLRTIIILGTMIIIAFMYYRWDLPLFNIFAYIAIYTISIITTVVFYLKERR